MANEIVNKNKSPAEMIQMAVEGKADLEKLKGLLDLQERWEANEARKAYHKAMAEFKANPPKIDKDKQVAYGNTKYNHASLANVTEKISQELSKHGLSASWTTKTNGTISVTCRITHVQGHGEETTITAPADNSGSKNVIQAIGSTITYLERYTLLALTGLATHDMDDDAQAVGAPIEYIDNSQVSFIMDVIDEYKLPLGNFLKYMGADVLEKILKKDYPKAESALEAARKVKKGEAEKKKVEKKK